MTKKQIRAAFRKAVFERDQYRCAKCGASDELDAHHITDRSEMPDGGYVVENGISLCKDCHWKAEQFHATGSAVKGYAPDNLYRIIGSSREQARKEAEGRA